MGKVKRTDRLTGEYRREISAIIEKKMRSRFPEITGIVSVTDAAVAPDLKNATVYVSIYSKSEQAKKTTFDCLVKNAGFIRHELAQVMRMRTVPMLRFAMDNSMEYGNHIEQILMDIRKEEEERNAASGEASDDEKSDDEKSDDEESDGTEDEE